MLYPYAPEGKTKSEYVPFLIDQIMEKPFTEKDKQKADDDEYNPIATLTPNALEKIFNGSRNISKKHAKIIRAHLDKEKFDNYIITKFNDEAIDSFCKTLKNAGISITDDSVSLTCANIFENILKDIIKGNPKDSTTLKVKKAEPPKDDRPFEEVFNDAVREFDIEGFLESNPTESLLPHFFDDMIAFNGIIQRSYKDKNTLHKDENTSYKMNEFSEILLKYVKYLNKRMKPISTKKVKSLNYTRVNASYVKYESPKDNKNFGRYSLKYRNNLKSLYDEIQTLQQK